MCQCPQCEFTDSLSELGFYAWPKGEPATPAEARKLYAAHAAFNWKDARKREGVGAVGAGFYGVPAGLTKRDVERVLITTFAQSVEAA